MKATGQFFARIVVGIGYLQLIFGTIGLIIWGNEESTTEGWFFDTTEKPNLPFALAALIPNLFVSSLFISFGAYIYMRLDQMPELTKKPGLAVGSAGLDVEGQRRI